MKAHKISVICTTLNEQDTVSFLLEGLALQSYLPSEILFCDANSSDLTQKIITDFSDNNKHLNIKLLIKAGNRSVGRNLAIKASMNDLIAITDAGCVPEKKWLAELVHTFDQSKASVVAGYYKGLPKSPFEEAVVPYALVMPDRVNEADFLPATRSMMLKKEVWKQLGGFNEQLALNEDYPFAKKIQSLGIPTAFARRAVVGWIPRKNLREFERMISKFAQGDIEAGIIRPKVIFIFIRYLMLIVFLIVMMLVGSSNKVLPFLLTVFVLYSGWSIQKNIRYVKKGWYWLPVLQYVADYAVMKGSIKSVLNNSNNQFKNK